MTPPDTREAESEAVRSDLRLDAVGVGVGPFNLSLAALLAPTGYNARFFDKRQDFEWHPGLLFPGATINSGSNEIGRSVQY
jgi:lysine/ornithine N-monooxygenase